LMSIGSQQKARDLVPSARKEKGRSRRQVAQV
jgi:hypothetical protein